MGPVCARGDGDARTLHMRERVCVCVAQIVHVLVTIAIRVLKLFICTFNTKNFDATIPVQLW